MHVRTDIPLSPPEVHKVVAQAILAMDRDSGQGSLIDAASLVNPESCATKIGLSGNDVRTFYEVNKASFKGIANPFVNRLITANIIERDWASHPNLHRLNPERAKSLESITTLDGFTTLEFVETIIDADLRSRCEATVLRNEFADSLLREALTVLEDRLRNLLPDSHEGRVDRRNVPGLVLSPDKGYSPVGKDAATQRDFMMLVSGMVGLWSEVHHSLIDVDPSAVRRVIGMIDVILEMLP